ANAIAAFTEATRIWDQFINDTITVNIEVGWGINLDTVTNAFASSPSIPETYSNVRAALQSDQSSVDDTTAIGALPAGNSFGLLINRTANNPNGSGSATPYLDNNGDANNTTIQVKRANAKAIGLLDPNHADIDGRIIFNS